MLLVLLPLGLLLQTAAPIAQPLVAEANKALENIGYQATKNFPDDPLGVGRHGQNREKSDFARQIEIESARLQQQFGADITDLATLGVALIGATVALTYVAFACSPTLQQELPEGSWLRPENKRWHPKHNVDVKGAKESEVNAQI